MNIQKANVETRPPPAASLGPIIKLSLSLSLALPRFPCALFVFILKGMVTFSRRLKQGRSGMVALVRKDCKCRYRLDSQCHLSFASLFLRLGHKEWYGKEKCTQVGERSTKNRIQSSTVHTRKQFSMRSLDTPSSTQEQPYSHPSLTLALPRSLSPWSSCQLLACALAF